MKKAGSKTDIIPKTVQDTAQGGPGEVSRVFWEGLGVAWKGSGAAPEDILGAFWGARIGANSDSAIRSYEKETKKS